MASGYLQGTTLTGLLTLRVESGKIQKHRIHTVHKYTWLTHEKYARNVHLEHGAVNTTLSFCAVLYMGSNQSHRTIFTYKCIGTTVHHPVVYTAHKGRRQLPSENIQLHISHTHLKHRVCITSWASGCNWESEKQSNDIFNVGICQLIVTWQELLCVYVLMQLCLRRCGSTGGVCMCICMSYQCVISGRGGLYFLCVWLPHNWHSLPCFCFVSLCHKLTYLGKDVTNRLPATLAERV